MQTIQFNTKGTQSLVNIQKVKNVTFKISQMLLLAVYSSFSTIIHTKIMLS